MDFSALANNNNIMHYYLIIIYYFSLCWHWQLNSNLIDFYPWNSSWRDPHLQNFCVFHGRGFILNAKKSRNKCVRDSNNRKIEEIEFTFPAYNTLRFQSKKTPLNWFLLNCEKFGLCVCYLSQVFCSVHEKNRAAFVAGSPSNLSFLKQIEIKIEKI